MDIDEKFLKEKGFRAKRVTKFLEVFERRNGWKVDKIYHEKSEFFQDYWYVTGEDGEMLVSDGSGEEDNFGGEWENVERFFKGKF